ncbi:dienelactone hydrolase family protein [Aestuariivivens sediminis]|uniref:dienelactone hydrolase family protein n=1 Tax=Aestuariivivens sediminis TaxID=2913557 RepID=UPI001F578CC2|nr:dienelactone hydrolase family protein [Aestuariivivens sediminis]
MKLNLYFILVLTCILFNCNRFEEEFVNGGNDPDPTGPRTAEDVIADFKAIDFQPGINDVSLESTTEGYFWNFRVIVPEDASETNKKPMIFSLHGGAQNTAPDAHKNTDCLISPGIENIIDAFVVSPNSNSYLWYHQLNQIQILALHDLITSNLPVDIDKMAITGYSDGGNGSWFYAQYYPHLFNAAIPLATSYNTAKNDGSIEAFAHPLYVIHGENDQLFPLEITQGFVNESIAAGSEIAFVVASGLDHYSVCDYLPYFRDAAVWLNTLWNN